MLSLLAMLVQYLPLPVVGGYLAFIGLYCLEAGLSLMSGVQVTSLLGFDFLPQWEALLQPEALLSVMPGVVCGIGILLVLQARNPAQFSAQFSAQLLRNSLTPGILLVLQRVHHFLVLPSILLGIPLVFFAITYALGYSL